MKTIGILFASFFAFSYSSAQEYAFYGPSNSNDHNSGQENTSFATPDMARLIADGAGKALQLWCNEPAPENVLLFADRYVSSPGMNSAISDGRWKYMSNYEPDRPRFQMITYPLDVSKMGLKK